MRKNGFTLIELLVVIMILGILLSLQIPNVNVMRERARQTAVKANMHFCQVVIETYHLEQGHYADDFYEDGYGSYFPGGVFEVKLGKFPTNPYTGKELTPEDFDEEDYDNKEDCFDTREDGPNDVWGYDPGTIRYGVWYPPGSQYPSNYALIGFNIAGESIRSYNPEHDEVIIFVLHN